MIKNKTFDAKTEFINSLIINCLHSKIENDLKSLLEYKDLYFHFISEALNFEKTLKNFHDYDEKSFQTNKVCVLKPVLDNDEYFEAWLKYEKKRNPPLNKTLHSFQKNRSLRSAQITFVCSNLNLNASSLINVYSDFGEVFGHITID